MGACPVPPPDPEKDKIMIKLDEQSAVLKTKPLQTFFQQEIIYKKIVKQKKIKPKNITKIFTASEYAYEAQQFHNKTDGYQNTILLVITTQKRVFGGFTVCTWRKDKLYQYETDEKGLSFLFSLKPMQQNNIEVDQTKKIDYDNNDKVGEKNINKNNDQTKNSNDNNINKNNSNNNDNTNDNTNDNINDNTNKNNNNNDSNNKQKDKDNKNKKDNNVKQSNVNRNSKNANKQKPTFYCFQTYKIKKNKKKAIMNHNCDVGPIFGEGYDIRISNRCNRNESWCSIGKTYSSPHPHGSSKANQELCGKEKFIIQNYQIWHLELNNEKK